MSLIIYQFLFITYKNNYKYKYYIDTLYMTRENKIGIIKFFILSCIKNENIELLLLNILVNRMN